MSDENVPESVMIFEDGCFLLDDSPMSTLPHPPNPFLQPMTAAQLIQQSNTEFYEEHVAAERTVTVTDANNAVPATLDEGMLEGLAGGKEEADRVAADMRAKDEAIAREKQAAAETRRRKREEVQERLRVQRERAAAPDASPDASLITVTETEEKELLTERMRLGDISLPTTNQLQRAAEVKRYVEEYSGPAPHTRAYQALIAEYYYYRYGSVTLEQLDAQIAADKELMARIGMAKYNELTEAAGYGEPDWDF